MTHELPFGSRYGLYSIPKPLQIGELSRKLRVQLWANVYSRLSNSMRISEYGFPSTLIPPWEIILKEWHVCVLQRPVDEFSFEVSGHEGRLKQLILQGTYVQVFEFLEFVMSLNECPSEFAELIQESLTTCQAAYSVIDKRYIVPTASREEKEAIDRAFKSLEDTTFVGARSHLLRAGLELNNGQYAASVRESMHAVESISRVIVPGTTTLGPALAELERNGEIHPALKNAFKSLYGFACDEQGIRHSLLDKIEPDVDSETAVFLFGACASFVSYLSTKAKNTELHD